MLAFIRRALASNCGHEREQVYELARKHTLYRLSSLSFLLWLTLSLTLKREELWQGFGCPGTCYLVACGSCQSLFSYLVYIFGPLWPDLFLGACMAGWARSVYELSTVAWWLLCASGGVALSFSLYLKHSFDSRRWIWAHIAWHCLPLVIYLFSTEPTVLDRVLLFVTCWAAVAAHMGAATFVNTAAVHDAHAIICTFSALLVGFGGFEHLEVSTLAFSFAYFAVDAVTCARTRDWMFVGHAAIALVLIGNCFAEEPPVRSLGVQVLIIEASTPLMHQWQRDASLASFRAFVASFFAVRCCFLPWQTCRIWNHILDFRSLFLVPLNLLQFAWFAKLAPMLMNYHPHLALRLAKSKAHSNQDQCPTR